MEHSMTHSTLGLAAALAAAATLTSAPASAVTDGEQDGDAHPYVGLMVAQDADGAPLWRCSGTLISPTLFLTAGHCTEAPAAKVALWFDADMQTNSAAKGYPFVGTASGTPHAHPQYDPNAFTRYDVGVVVLDAPVSKSQYGALPTLDQLSTMRTQRGRQDVTFTAVGYGLQQSFPDAASFLASNVKVRMVAHPHLLQIDTSFTGSYSLLLSNNASTGGTCFGDSGGPNLLGTSNVVAGVTSYGINGNCAGTGGVYRMDRADALDWVRTFLQ
jgi:V8-like Glu-specific endopeptidase